MSSLRAYVAERGELPAARLEEFYLAIGTRPFGAGIMKQIRKRAEKHGLAVRETRDEPVIVLLCPPAVCSFCGKADPPQTCGACRMVGYCDRQCQTNDWNTHADVC